ncbi:MAG: YggS family pyridoxal phosphate-dependent enzyme [Eubacterium sp.]|nr:YggS family pyridoxal phosphate-dependent enzyme [Eubacterium sp.]
MSEVSENLKEVEKRIRAACERSGRDRSEVSLIAVSKTKPIEMIREAMGEGISVFGENKVQELVAKHDELEGNNLEWHMIGHLQRNKVNKLPGRVKMIHSVDSLRLAEEIEHQFGKADIVADILVEVNMAGEESKFGLAPQDVEPFLLKIANFNHICPRGLMTIAPFVEDPEENRKIFADLRKLLIDIQDKNYDNIDMTELSMGMTGDYEVAIEEGATFVRVGTGIFGSRNYEKG